MNYKITFYQLNNPQDSDEERDDIYLSVLPSIEALTGTIPGVMRVKVGKRVSPSHEYSHCIMVETESFDALTAYCNDKKVMKLNEKLKRYELPSMGIEFVTSTKDWT